MPAHKSEKVLVVDDEVDLCDLLKDFIASLGFDVRTAHTGREALDTLEVFPAFLVLSDINMPHINGIELFEKIAATQQPRPFVILCTGFEGYDADELKSRGVLEVLKKPFDFDALGSLITNAVQKKTA